MDSFRESLGMMKKMMFLVLGFLGAVSTIAGSIYDAAKCGNLDEVKRILDTGIDVNVKDQNGYSALDYAVLNGHYEMAECLVKEYEAYFIFYSCTWGPTEIEKILLNDLRYFTNLYFDFKPGVPLELYSDKYRKAARHGSLEVLVKIDELIGLEKYKDVMFDILLDRILNNEKLYHFVLFRYAYNYKFIDYLSGDRKQEFFVLRELLERLCCEKELKPTSANFYHLVFKTDAVSDAFSLAYRSMALNRNLERANHQKFPATMGVFETPALIGEIMKNIYSPLEMLGKLATRELIIPDKIHENMHGCNL